MLVVFRWFERAGAFVMRKSEIDSLKAGNLVDGKVEVLKIPRVEIDQAPTAQPFDDHPVQSGKADHRGVLA